MSAEYPESKSFDSAVATIEDSVRTRALCRARLLAAQAASRAQTATAARVVEETRALLSSLRRVPSKENGPVDRRGGEPRKEGLAGAQPAWTSIDFDLHRPAPPSAFTKCGPAEAPVRITASIATLALGEQYNQVMVASIKGQPLDASVVRQKLRRIEQLLDPGGQESL